MKTARKWILIACGLILCLGLTATLFLGPLVVLKTTGYTEKARRVKIESDLRAIILAAEIHRAVQGSYPKRLEEAGGADDPLWTDRDPWGNNYTYRVLGDRVRVSCLGPDGREGGNDDIVLEAGLDDDPIDLGLPSPRPESKRGE